MTALQVWRMRAGRSHIFVDFLSVYTLLNALNGLKCVRVQMLQRIASTCMGSFVCG